jgi:phosphodiesterase/alkaline phosphatase D-like protein
MLGGRMPDRAVRTTRRTLVAGAGSLAAGLVLSTPAHARLVTSTRGVGPGAFLDGVASGEPAPDAVTLWGRITTERPRTAARLIVASDPDLRTIVATVTVPTAAGVDHTLKARVGGLRPDTHYWYVWQSSDGMSPVGRTKTAPDPASDKTVAIGYSSCQRLTEGFFNAHGDAATQDLDLYAFLGDYTYEYQRAREAGGASDELTTNDLASYRAKLRFYRTDPHLRELHRLHPTVHVWDDHEVENDYGDGEPTPSAMQRASGYRASFEWHPRLSVPGDRYRLYRNWRLGKHAELLMLDQRQYRTVGAPGQTILGRPQMDWVKSGLSRSGASWKFLGNPTMIAPLGLNGPAGGVSFNPDQWDGYPAERDELLGHIGTAGITDAVFLTGDIHIFFANELPIDSKPLSGSRVVATEYVGGSVTSEGVPATIEAIGNGAIQAINPQFRYVQGAMHGWAVLRAGAQELRVDYRASDITTQGAPSDTIASFVQARGANRFDQMSGTPGGDARVAARGELSDRPAKTSAALRTRRQAEAGMAEAAPAARRRLAERHALQRTRRDDRSRDRRRAA